MNLQSFLKRSSGSGRREKFLRRFCGFFPLLLRKKRPGPFEETAHRFLQGRYGKARKHILVSKGRVLFRRLPLHGIHEKIPPSATKDISALSVRENFPSQLSEPDFPEKAAGAYIPLIIALIAGRTEKKRLLGASFFDPFPEKPPGIFVPIPSEAPIS